MLDKASNYSVADQSGEKISTNISSDWTFLYI
jgi:hypothetical protein